jgi:hypothetical protein
MKLTGALHTDYALDAERHPSGKATRSAAQLTPYEERASNPWSGRLLDWFDRWHGLRWAGMNLRPFRADSAIGRSPARPSTRAGAWLSRRAAGGSRPMLSRGESLFNLFRRHGPRFASSAIDRPVVACQLRDQFADGSCQHRRLPGNGFRDEFGREAKAERHCRDHLIEWPWRGHGPPRSVPPKTLKPFGARNASSVRFGEAHRPPLAMALVTDELRHGRHLHGGLVAGGAAILSAHRFDATFAIGGRAWRPRILGIGANFGHHEHRNPNTRVATDARG